MLQINEHDKFFTRLLSKESNDTSMGCPSFRVYYGGVSDSVAVPFVWEAKPGTPKQSFSHFDDDDHHHHHLHLNDDQEREIPPLTPPPPISPVIYDPKKKKKPTSNKKVKFLVRLFIRIMRRIRCKGQISSAGVRASSASLSTSSSSHLEAWLDYVANRDKDEVEEGGGMASPGSILCFGFVGHQTKAKV